MTPTETVLGRLEGVAVISGGWQAKCPAHEDARPSLSVSTGDDGKVLVKCHVGCEFNAIVEALGLTTRDMFPADERSPGSASIPQDASAPPRITETYDYHDRDGTVLYQSVRYHPKDFKRRRPDGKGGSIWSLEGVRKVLYRLPEIIEKPDDWVFLVEGEKDVETLRAAGLLATTFIGGAKSWSDEYAEPLRDRRVAICGDNDKDGRELIVVEATALTGVVNELRVLDLPGLPEKGDVSDWFASGGTREELEEILDATPQYVPNSIRAHKEGALRETNTGPFRGGPVKITELVAGTKIPAIWDGGRIYRGCSTVLAGAPKAGKTTLLAHLLRTAAAGGDLAGTYVAPCSVLVISEENSALWMRRRDALGLGEHISVWSRPFLGRPKMTDWTLFIDAVTALVAGAKYDMVVFDTIASLWPVFKENDAGEVLAALAPLTAILETGAAIVLIHHHRKSDGPEATGVRGSSALTGWVDSIIELRRYRQSDESDKRRVVSSLSRFDAEPETVIELTDDGYITVGSKSDTKRADRFATIQKILPTDGDGYTAEEVRAKWPDDQTTPGKRTVETDLSAGAKQYKWQRTGSGVKNDAYKFKCVSRSPLP